MMGIISRRAQSSPWIFWKCHTAGHNVGHGPERKGERMSEKRRRGRVDGKAQKGLIPHPTASERWQKKNKKCAMAESTSNTSTFVNKTWIWNKPVKTNTQPSEVFIYGLEQRKQTAGISRLISPASLTGREWR